MATEADPAGELPQEALDELERRLERDLEGANQEFSTSLFRRSGEPNATELTSVDWVAFPERIAACLGRERALSLLDIPDEVIGAGGRSLQEEYAEWRVVRSERGIESVDVTTETADHWRLLAAYSPTKTLESVRAFAREQEIDIRAVYGALDPFASDTTPAEREAAFVAAMLEGGTSPYNNGERAITCMVHRSNTMAALLSLAIAASCSLEVLEDSGRRRCATCAELNISLKGSAQMGRASDPLLVERFAQLAFEGRRVLLDVPGPLAISGVENARLRTPSGSPVPREWFRSSRPARSDGRYQRVSFRVPPEEGFCVSDLIDVTTEQRITTGAQVADLVQVSLYLRTSGPADGTRASLSLADDGRPNPCSGVVETVRALEEKR
jgi:hypothetical protein